MLDCDDDGVILDSRFIFPFLRTAYNYDRDLESLRAGLHCDDATKAQQQFAEECDINTIVERFAITGELPAPQRMPFNGDFEEAVDLRESLDLLRAADEAFHSFPAPIRAQFENDPVKFVDFVSDPANIDKAREWGLARGLEAPRAPIDVRVIPTLPEAPKTPPAASLAPGPAST